MSWSYDDVQIAGGDPGWSPPPIATLAREVAAGRFRSDLRLGVKPSTLRFRMGKLGVHKPD